jgi:hypothetical protein
VGQAWEIAIVALVECLQAKEVCRHAGGGSRTLLLPSQSGCVVRERVDCLLPAVHVMHEDIVLCDGACELEIRVGDQARGVTAADDVVADGLRER